MLVLARSKDQKLMIWNPRTNDEILITVVRGSARLGIDAPDDWEIDRIEVYRKKRAELKEDDEVA